MERHGIEWGHKGIDRPHLEVLDYKLQECQRELAELDAVVKGKSGEANILERQIENFTERARVITTISQNFENEPEYPLPAPAAMMSARSYKTKFVAIKPSLSLRFTFLSLCGITFEPNKAE